MRLLHTDTLQFSEYVSPNDAPAYIIASHRWLEGEVSYQEFLRDRRNTAPEIILKPGWDKILHFCNYIKDWRTCSPDGDIPQYLWIDTCCINKESSAELQEAITSMFEWYAQAWCCLAWLHDVKVDGVEALNNSVWFKRGMARYRISIIKLLTVDIRMDSSRTSGAQDRRLPRRELATFRAQVQRRRPSRSYIERATRCSLSRGFAQSLDLTDYWYRRSYSMGLCQRQSRKYGRATSLDEATPNNQT